MAVIIVIIVVIITTATVFINIMLIVPIARPLGFWGDQDLGLFGFTSWALY